MIVFVSKREKELVDRLRALEPIPEAARLTRQVIDLKRQVADLEIEKSKRQEEFEKAERELRHMVGLEQKRQMAEREQAKVELAQASKAAELSVREENLKAERKRFEEQLEFNTQRFAQMEKYLKDMMSDILARLPNINMQVTKTL